ncbi:MAG: acyltransferase family protein [Deltaproteobacteria bacterium]|nr:acyltransferase family protein [Deltaproteobacteria bacterium]
MLESAADKLKEALKAWTMRMVPEDLPQKVAAARAKQNEFGLDPFGYSMDFAFSGIAPFVWLYKHYFRVDTQGLENIPRGRVLLVSNHSGQLPFDAAMIGMAVLVEADPPRPVRSMVEKWMPTLPFVSIFMARMGQVVGTPENCKRLLEAGEAILVFPEGQRGINKHWRDRYQLADFGLGFMRMALETDTPIVPVSVVGGEEQAPKLFDLKPLARLLGFPSFPITPTLLPIPLPSRYHLRFGEPLRFEGSPHDEDAELEHKVREVKATIQAMLNKGLKERKRVFF